MKNRVQIALVSTLLSVFIHLYLTSHYFALKFGTAVGQSLCNVSEKLNCDAVSASAFSTALGIPLSIWGAIVNAILFGMILLAWLEWTDHPERLRRWALLLSGMSLGASVVMAAVSVLFLNNYCLFCIGLYILSALTFFCYLGVLREPFIMHFKRDLPKMWAESRGILIALLSVPLLAVLINKMYTTNMANVDMSQTIRDALAEWEASPKHEFVAKPALVAGPAPEKAAMTIAEFADFRCSHCKHASYSLDAFISAHPDVRFEFYNFPLDGSCNEKIPGGDGVSCRIAASIVCAQAEGKGWEMHKRMFASQDEVLKLRSISELDVILSSHAAQFGLNWETFSRCLSDTAVIDSIKSQAKQGALVNVQGTPTIFANGRQLPYGQTIGVLQAARELSLKKASN